MNNDLISRSILKEHIERYADIPCYAKQEVYDRIEDCNTAYDVDKVEKQIEEEFERIVAELLEKTGSELQLCDFNIKPFTRRLTDILKAGGVNE